MECKPSLPIGAHARRHRRLDDRAVGQILHGVGPNSGLDHGIRDRVTLRIEHHPAQLGRCLAQHDSELGLRALARGELPQPARGVSRRSRADVTVRMDRRQCLTSSPSSHQHFSAGDRPVLVVHDQALAVHADRDFDGALGLLAGHDRDPLVPARVATIHLRVDATGPQSDKANRALLIARGVGLLEQGIGSVAVQREQHIWRWFLVISPDHMHQERPGRGDGRDCDGFAFPGRRVGFMFGECAGLRCIARPQGL